MPQNQIRQGMAYMLSTRSLKILPVGKRRNIPWVLTGKCYSCIVQYYCTPYFVLWRLRAERQAQWQCDCVRNTTELYGSRASYSSTCAFRCGTWMHVTCDTFTTSSANIAIMTLSQCCRNWKHVIVDCVRLLAGARSAIKRCHILNMI